MSSLSERIPPSWGGPLQDSDYANLDRSWITRELADEAMLRRVSDEEGRQVVGLKRRRNCAGILFPYYRPREAGPVSYRIRRDHPDMVAASDGTLKQEAKYLSAPGSRNHLYFPPGITVEQLADPNISLVLVEGEKKALALYRLAKYQSDRLRFIPVALAGVWADVW